MNTEGEGERRREEVRRIEVAVLLGEAREAVLVHKGEDYRLRVTSKGRLVLTK